MTRAAKGLQHPLVSQSACVGWIDGSTTRGSFQKQLSPPSNRVRINGVLGNVAAFLFCKLQR